MFALRRHIPNALTSLNLFSGCLAVVSVLVAHDFLAAFYFILLAAVFDFFDGFVARLLHVSSPIGKELDSLADCVSFGVAPSAILFVWLNDCTLPFDALCDRIPWFQSALPYTAFLLAVCSALRLAKFNLDERQVVGFIGLPTPACTLFFASLAVDSPVLLYRYGGFLLLLVFFFCYLLTSEIPMFALKFKHFALRGNLTRYGFLLGALVILLWGGLPRLWLTIFLYLVIALVQWLVSLSRSPKEG